MKNFLRAVGASLLGICLLAFSLWRYDIFPDLSGVTSWLQTAKDQADNWIQATEELIDETVSGSGLLGLTRPVETGNEYSGHLPTSEISEDLLEVICDAYDEHDESVDLTAYEMTADELKTVVSGVRFSYPVYFYVGDTYTYAVSKDTGFVTEFCPKYLVDRATADQQIAKYEQTVAEIAAAGPMDGSDFEKALYLHDYFVQNYNYDYTYTIRDAYTFFEGKTGVCQAYMLAFIATAEAMGLEALPVTSNAMNHAWNLVEVDGEWYHMDITWDDSGSYPSYTSYIYFLQSDNNITAYDEAHTDDPAYIHHEWTTSQKATDTRYDDAIWRDCRAPLVALNDAYYCILSVDKGAGGILYRGSDPITMSEIGQIDGMWRYQNTNSYYPGCFSGLVKLEDELIYNTDKTLRAYNVKTGEDRLVAILSLDQYEVVYGIHSMNAETRTVTVVAAVEPNGEYDQFRYIIP